MTVGASDRAIESDKHDAPIEIAPAIQVCGMPDKGARQPEAQR